ncbi:MAG: 2-C-methyl-D-erythritol 4-phosphate cytidylyltransferase [Phycisphaerae bacterium]
MAMKTSPFTVILPAAGSGNRFGGDKLLADLCGRTVLARTVELFASRPDVAALVIATSPDRFSAYRSAASPERFGVAVHFTPGGVERWDTVYNALSSSAVSTELVAIHDAARPLTPHTVIDAAFSAALEHGSALPAVPEPATLKAVDTDGVEKRVSRTVDRRRLYQAQTPQCFRTQLLRDAFATLIARGQTAEITDDAQVAELAGISVVVTTGSNLNVKITHSEDMLLARAIYKMQHADAGIGCRGHGGPTS